MKNLILLLAIFTFVSCEDSKEEFYNLEMGFDFSVINSNNEDLLNPSTSNSYKYEDIKLYYLVNGIKEEVFDSNLDNPRNFSIYKDERDARYKIGLFLNHIDKSEITTTYLSWNENETDTIESKLRRGTNGIIREKVWLNGKLIWEINDNTIQPYYLITK